MTLIPDTAGHRILELSWNPDTGTYIETEAPVLAWELASDQDPHPVTLLGPMMGLAWCVLEPSTGQAYIPCEIVFTDREAAVRELRHQARRLAGLDS